MKTFAEMDQNKDGTIDLKEFQDEMDKLFKTMNLHSKQSIVKQKKKTGGKAKDWKKWML